MNPCQALEAAFRDATAEMGANSKMRRTISGGRTVMGSAVIFQGQLLVEDVDLKSRHCLFGARHYTADPHRLLL